MNSKKCVLENKNCIDCEKCDLCDLDNTRVCNSCGKCISEDVDYKSIIIDDILDIEP